MKIGADGNLTIYPIGIDTVPRRWKEVPSDGYTSKLEPEDGSQPRLIEDPIIVKR